MKYLVSRRCFIGRVGAGASVLAAASKTSVAQTETPELAVDRSPIIDWGERPMYLRPYHPPYVVYYYGMRFEKKSQSSSIKWDPLIARVEKEPELRICIIEAFDDACAGCSSLKTDPLGSIWGVGHTCSSAQDPDMVALVIRTNRRILGELGLNFGDEILMRDMVLLLEKNVPVLYEGIGGPDNQAFYERGLKALKEKYGL